MSNVLETTIITAVRNRNETIKQTLPSWLAVGISEIIIVDFRDDGCESVWDVVEPFDDVRIKVIETKYEYMFIHGLSNNLAIDQASNKYVLKLESDYILQGNFFEENQIPPHSFIGGVLSRDWHKWGLLYVEKKYLEACNGYNENIIYPTCSDTDLEERLRIHLRKIQLDEETVYHLPHSDDIRFDGYIKQAKKETGAVLHHASIRFNNVLIKAIPWTAESKRNQWTLSQIEPNRYLALRAFGQKTLEK